MTLVSYYQWLSQEAIRVYHKRFMKVMKQKNQILKNIKELNGQTNA